MRTFMMLLRKNDGWIIFLDRFSILVSIRGPILPWNQLALNTKVEAEINWILIPYRFDNDTEKIPRWRPLPMTSSRSVLATPNRRLRKPCALLDWESLTVA